MKQKNGYTVPELLILMLVVGVIAAIGIGQVSYAFSQVTNEGEQELERKHLVEQASLAYVKSKKENFQKEESFIFAKEVAEAGFLFEKEEYNQMKIRVTYQESTDSFLTEVVD